MSKIQIQTKLLNKIDDLLDKKNKSWDILHLAKAYRALEKSKKNGEA